MEIDGLDEKPKPVVENLGEFKLKDREGRRQVQLDLLKLSRPLNEARHLYIAKVHGQNNRIKVSIHWKPKASQSKVKKIMVGGKEVALRKPKDRKIKK